MKNCYIHIPFCNRICSYCDFCKEFYNKKKVKIYLKKLREEINSIYQQELLNTIYIGGGTPSCLDLEELKELFSITDLLKTSSNLEFTVEVNIESLTEEKLRLMKDHRVNRLSIGIESIHPKHQELLERKNSEEEIINTMQLIRSIGFQNVNVDLIYAIPNETVEEVKEDLDFILSLQVEHISTYSLIIEDHTKLKIKNIKPIKEELDIQMYEMIVKKLKKNHYHHYEISNFCKKGYESKHNLCYWLNEEYYGFGLGAASYIKGIRRINTRSINHYPNVYLEEEIVNLDSQKDYEILLNLRLIEGISLERYRKKYKNELKEDYDYQILLKNKYLIEENDYLRIPENYLYISNEIIVKLLQEKKN